jgi:hypothetical protein
VSALKLWLTPEEAKTPAGYDSLNSLWRDLREGRFPWEYRKVGNRYRISARSLGLVTEEGAENSETRIQTKSVTTQV